MALQRLLGIDDQVDQDLDDLVVVHLAFGKVVGKVDAELRWEIFNLFNTTNFGLPENNFDSIDFGTIKGQRWPDFWHGEGHAQALAAVEEATRGGTGRFQGFATTLAGTRRWWDVVVTRIASGPLVRASNRTGSASFPMPAKAKAARRRPFSCVIA